MHPDSDSKPWLLPSADAFIFIFIFWMSLLFMPQMMNGDGDLGRHLTVGEYILDTGEIPKSDLFSHTMTNAPFVPHEWLSELVFALAYRAAGLNGVAWLTALVLASAYALLTAGIRRLGVRAFVALGAAGVAAIVGTLHTLTRPHIFTLLLFTIFLAILEIYRRNGRRRILLFLPLLMIVWVNAHGAFISGLVLVAFYAVGALFERKRRRAMELLGLLALLLVATWINPVGPALVSHSSGYLQQRFLVDMTIEYRSPDFHAVNTWPFAALLVLSLTLSWRTDRRLDWTGLVLLAGWTAFALYSARNIPLYASVATTMLAREADSFIDEIAPSVGSLLSRADRTARMSWGWMWVVLIVAILVILEGSGAKLDIWRMGNDFSPQVFPVAAIDALEDTLPEGQVFNEFIWGGYMLYRLWPQKRVFIDGQTDFYGERLTRQYLQVLDATPGWNQILHGFDVQWVIVPPSRPLAFQLEISPDWQSLYRDETAVVWGRCGSDCN